MDNPTNLDKKGYAIPSQIMTRSNLNCLGDGFQNNGDQICLDVLNDDQKTNLRNFETTETLIAATDASQSILISTSLNDNIGSSASFQRKKPKIVHYNSQPNFSFNQKCSEVGLEITGRNKKWKSMEFKSSKKSKTRNDLPAKQRSFFEQVLSSSHEAHLEESDGKEYEDSPSLRADHDSVRGKVSGSFGFVKVSEDFYKLVKIQETDRNECRIFMLEDKRSNFLVPSNSVYILQSRHCEHHFDEEALHKSTARESLGSLDEGATVFARFGGEATFAFGVVIGREIHKSDLMVQFHNGPIFMVNRLDCYMDSEMQTRLKALAPTSVSEKLEMIPTTKYRHLMASSLFEVLAAFLYLGLWSYGYRLKGDRLEPDTVWRNNMCFIGSIMNVFSGLKCLHLMYRLRINYRETMLWQFTIRVIQMVCFDGYIISGSAGALMMLLSVAIWLERVIMAVWFVRANLRVDHNCRLECVPNEDDDKVKSDTGLRDKSNVEASRFSWRRSKSRQDSFFLKSNPINIPTETHLIMERSTVTFKYLTCIMISIVVFLFVPVLLFESYRLLSDQNPFFNVQDLNEINGEMRGTNFTKLLNRTIHGNVEEGDSIHVVTTNNRVFMVLLDGFRFDAIHRSSQFQSFMDDIKNDSILITMQSQVPTMSVPNWMSLITGAPPAITGVLGNLDTGGSAFENIFSLCSDWGLVSGVTGSDWFSELIQVFLSVDVNANSHNDFTQPYEIFHNAMSQASYFGSTSSNPVIADQQRFENLYSALKGDQTKFDFFMAHLSSLDTFGHLYGLNNDPLRRYWNTVDLFAEHLRRVVNILPLDATLIITSDHGHVNRGGHGGISEDLLKVPAIFYKKNTGIGIKDVSSAAKVYPSIDLTPTITALLGIPPPATSFGTPIPNVITRILKGNSRARVETQTIWEAQQNVLTRNFLQKLNVNNTRLSNGSVSGMRGDSFDFLDSLYDEKSDGSFISRLFFSRCLAGLTWNTLIGGLFFAISYVALIELIRHVSPIRMSVSEVLFSKLKPVRSVLRQELVCLIGSITYLLCYLISMILVFYITWFMYGYNYNTIESTIIHHPNMILPTVMTIFVPSFMIQWLLNRLYLYFIQFSLGVFKKQAGDENYPESSDGLLRRIFRGILILLCLYHPVSISNPYVANDGPSSLRRNTILYHKKKQVSRLIMCKLMIYSYLVFCLTIFVAYSNFLPRFSGLFAWVRITEGMLGIPTVLKSAWNFRFRLLLMFWMLLPGLCGQMIMVMVSLRQLMFTVIFMRT